MKWIVGLGNPGKQYAATRHNIGFMAVDHLADQLGITFQPHKCNALVGEGQYSGQKIVLLKPMTFMNLSGQAVRAYMDYYKLQLEQMVVLYDDLDTELGHLRLRYKGGAGGHNGIKSLIECLGTQSFKRIRLGISRPPTSFAVVDYVLSKFPKEQHPLLEKVLHDAAEAVKCSLEHPFDKVMAKFNG